MLTQQYTNNFKQPVLANVAAKARALVEFYAYDAPLLNQWHQLIEIMRQRANKRQWVTLINPPFIPNDKYLQDIGLGDHYVRVIRLKSANPESIRYIRNCLQNGKSSIVAVWASHTNDLPDILFNETHLGCQALVFSQSSTYVTQHQQLEMSF